jgi:para-nitrobenzyl esterase
MKKLLVALALIAATPAFAQAPAAPAQTAPAPAAPATPYSVQTTKIGTLLDTPALLVIFKKYLPEIVANPQVDEGRDLTLPEIVQYVPDIVTPEKLAAIDTELKALPQQ